MKLVLTAELTTVSETKGLPFVCAQGFAHVMSHPTVPPFAREAVPQLTGKWGHRGGVAATGQPVAQQQGWVQTQPAPTLRPRPFSSLRRTANSANSRYRHHT